MSGKGITWELIIQAATQLINENGFGNYTVRDLAARLGIKAASLYKHINSIDDVNQEICKRASVRMNEALTSAAAGLPRDEALAAVGHAFRAYAQKEPEMYHAILALPSLTDDADLLQYARESYAPLRNVVSEYKVPYEVRIRFSRCYRSALHGFVTQQEAGYYTNQKVTAESTFDFLIEGTIEWLHRLEDQYKDTV